MKHSRLMALILTLTASIFMLAHAVLPHSHHDGTICFQIEEIRHHHCSAHEDETVDCCEQEKKECHHAHAEYCNLQDIVFRQHSDTHEEILPSAHCLSLMYALYPLNEFYFEAPQFGMRLRQKPYLENYTSLLAGSVKNLRAPPVSYFG